jgi:uncharacterized protein (TIRG00374 family)
MNKLIKKLLQVLLPLLLGGFILFWVYRDFDFSKVSRVLFHEMEWGWMFLSLIFGALSHIVRGLRWIQSLEPLDAHPKQSNSIYAVFVAYAANLVLPRVGEVSRCGILSRYDQVSFSKSLGTVITERLLDSVCIGIITALAILLQWGVFIRFFQDTGTSWEAIATFFTSVKFLLILLGVILLSFLLFYLIRSRLFSDRIKRAIRNIWEGVRSLKGVRNKPLFIFYTLSIWLCYFLQFYITFYCFTFTADLSLLDALVLFVGGTVAVVVPTPNGAGPWHFTVISLMALYGIGITEAGVFALIVHGIQTFLLVLLGIYGLAALPLTNKKKYL